jgi:hypothetical protein
MLQYIFVTVFLLCAYDKDVELFMTTAMELGLMNGQYAFLAVDYGDERKASSNITQNHALDGNVLITIFVNQLQPRLVPKDFFLVGAPRLMLLPRTRLC